LAYEERDDRYTDSRYDFTAYTVYDVYYEKIGKVDGVFVGENDRPEYIGVKVGFLGTKATLIPVEIVRVNDRRQLVEVAADKDAVNEAPTFSDDREITPEFERRVLGYYGVETAQVCVEREAPSAYYAGAAGDEWLGLRSGERARTGEDRLRVARVDVDLEYGARGDEDEPGVQWDEEGLMTGTREREADSVRLRKRARVPENRQEVRAEPAPVEEGTGAPEPGIVDDEIRVPVIEEEVVVERRPVVKEMLRIRKKVVEDEEVIEEDIRKEEIDIDDRTERRASMRGDTNTDGKTVRRLFRESRNETRPEEHRETGGKKEASGEGQRQYAANAKAAKEAREVLPIKGYDDLTVEEAKKKLGRLWEGDLKKIRSYEKEHKNRKTLIEWLDRKIKDAS